MVVSRQITRSEDRYVCIYVQYIAFNLMCLSMFHPPFNKPTLQL